MMQSFNSSLAIVLIGRNLEDSMLNTSSILFLSLFTVFLMDESSNSSSLKYYKNLFLSSEGKLMLINISAL